MVLFLDYNKQKKDKSVTICGVTIWGHELYTIVVVCQKNVTILAVFFSKM